LEPFPITANGRAESDLRHRQSNQLARAT
jgi:hypothetical protein